MMVLIADCIIAIVPRTILTTNQLLQLLLEDLSSLCLEYNSIKIIVTSLDNSESRG